MYIELDGVIFCRNFEGRETEWQIGSSISSGGNSIDEDKIWLDVFCVESENTLTSRKAEVPWLVQWVCWRIRIYSEGQYSVILENEVRWGWKHDEYVCFHNSCVSYLKHERFMLICEGITIFLALIPTQKPRIKSPVSLFANILVIVCQGKKKTLSGKKYWSTSLSLEQQANYNNWVSHSISWVFRILQKHL